MLETIIRKLSDQEPEPSIFICGDFNFALGRTKFKQVLRSYGAEIFPEPSNRFSGNHCDRKEPIDFIVIRSSDIRVESREIDVTLLTKNNDQDPQTPNDISQAINLGVEVEECLDKRNIESSIKGEPIPDVPNQDTKTEDTPFKVNIASANPLVKPLFDHNGIHLCATLGVSPNVLCPTLNHLLK